METHTWGLVVPYLLPAVSFEILMMSHDHCVENVFFQQWCTVCPLLKLAYANIRNGVFLTC
jgi:hypothetical protein